MSKMVTLRPASPADEPFFRAVFADHGAHYELLGPDVRDILLDMDYCGHRREQLAAHPDLERFVVGVDGTDVGVLVIAPGIGVTEILELIIVRRHRGRGIGSTLLADVLPGPKAVTVRTRDAASRGLYTRLGFVEAEHTSTRVTLRAAA